MEYFSAFLLFAIVSTATPGPNNIMLMSSGLNFGIRRTLPHFFGVLLGFQCFILLIGFGLGSAFLRYPFFHQGIKIVGAFYLLYLAWRIAISHTHVNGGKKDKKPMTFFQAVLFQWVNPKGWSIGAGAIAAYTSVHGNIYVEVLTIALTYFCVFMVLGFAWVSLGKVLKRLLKKDYHQRYFNYVMGTLLALSVALIFIK